MFSRYRAFVARVAREKQGIREDLFHDEDSIDEVERKASSTLHRSGSVSTSFELIPSQNVVVSSSTAAAKQDNKNQAESNNSTRTTRTTRTTPGSESEGVIGGGLLSSVPLENVTTTSSSSSIAKPSQTKTFANLKKEKKSVEIAVKKFNKTPTMAVLREHARKFSRVGVRRPSFYGRRRVSTRQQLDTCWDLAMLMALLLFERTWKTLISRTNTWMKR